MAFDQGTRRRVFELDFKPYPGLVVRCRKPGFTALLQLSDAVLELGDDLSGDGLTGVAKLAAWDKLFRAFAKSLVSWTLLDRGHAVPATRKGVLDQDIEFLLALVRTWYVVVVPHQPVREAPPAPVAAPSEPEIDEARLADLPVTELPSVEDDVLVPA